jgi:hypothetical protein
MSVATTDLGDDFEWLDSGWRETARSGDPGRATLETNS